MEDVILTHRVLEARSTLQLSDSLVIMVIGKSLTLVLWFFVVVVTA